MDKVDYLFTAFNARAYTKKAFLLSIFSIINKGEDNKLTDIPYAALRDWENNTVYFIDPATKEKILLDNVTPARPIFIKNEPLHISASKCQYVKEDIPDTTVGRFLFYVVVFYEAFKEKAPYLNRQIEAKDIEKLIIDMMVDNPANNEAIPEGKVSVDNCLKVTQQLDYLEGLNPVFVKASSLDIFSIDPKIIALRDQMLNDLEAKGLLNDPVQIAKVIDTLVEEDAKNMYNGPSKDLFIKKAFISNSRRKMFIVFDSVPDFHTGKYELLRNSLAEGWELGKFNQYVNTAISASYSRSVSVGRAGYDTKVALLLTSGITVAGEDCGSTRTERVAITKGNISQWSGGYHLENGNLSLIEENALGKTLDIRVPQYCKQPEGNMCRVCCGTRLGAIGNRIPSEVTGILTTMFLLSMKAMHNSELHTRTFKLEELLR